MRFHKEGKGFILTTLTLFAASIAACFFFHCYVCYALSFILLLLFLFMLRFFRLPNRPLQQVEGAVLSPADGKIVIVQEVMENEYLKERRIQVSVFMSVWNVHINWFPVSGVVEYFRHHQGQYLVAWHPKSSELNERTTIVVNTGKTKLLFRQIAGYVARRIVCYANEKRHCVQNQQVGFIKFGSRVDLFLPLDAEVKVKVGDTVRGTETVLARLKE